MNKIRVCPKCKIEKPLDKKHFQMVYGKYKYECKICKSNYMRLYHAENQDKMMESWNKWYQNNKDKVYKNLINANARRIEVYDQLTDKDIREIFLKYNHRYIYCGDTRKLTIDHLTPLTRKGPNVKENLAIACGPCNSSKRNKTYDEYVEWLNERNIEPFNPVMEVKK